jgi:hypothetical protein
MKLIYQMAKFFCLGCGNPGYGGHPARVPAGVNPEKCGPGECGHCNGTRWRVEIQ